MLLNDCERFKDGHRLYKMLVALEGAPCTSRPNVDGDDVNIFDCIRGLRNEVDRWTGSGERSNLREYVEAQFLLARVSAGLNWANKPLELPGRKAAFVYAAWAAHEFMKRYTEDEWWRTLEVTSLRPDKLV